MKKIVLLILSAAFILPGCAGAGVKKLKYVELHNRDCSICNRMIPVIEAVSIKYAGKVDVDSYSTSSDTGESYEEDYRVKKFPANLFFDQQGSLYYRHEGLMDIKAVEQILDSKIKVVPVTETAK